MEIPNPLQVTRILMEMPDADLDQMLKQIGEPPADTAMDKAHEEWIERASAALVKWRAKNRGGRIG